MEYSGAAYIVMLNDPDLRQGLVGEARRARPAGPATAGSQPLRVWLAARLHVLATRIDPTTRVLDPQLAGTV
jgi:hypothetical protein